MGGLAALERVDDHRRRLDLDPARLRSAPFAADRPASMYSSKVAE
jgi:hypothetical protein